MSMPPSRGRRRSVAVLEDDEAVRESLAALLEAHGYRVALYPSAEKFLTAYRPGRCYCLVLDLRLGNGEAIAVLERLNADHGTRPPFILVTSRLDARAQRTAARFGALAVLEQPFGADALLGALERLSAG